MRIFKTRKFAKWAKNEGLSDKVLSEAVTEMEQGLVDANLGGFVYKKRVALPGHGKRSSLRTLLAFKINDKAFFIFGFAKNELENISNDELSRLKLFAQILIGYSEHALQKALDEKEIIQVKYHDKQ